MPPWLRVLAALAEDLDSAPGTHRALTTYVTPVTEVLMPFSSLCGSCTHVGHTYVQAKHSDT